MLRVTSCLLILLSLGFRVSESRADGVLFIGDSHVDSTFGRTLDSLLRTRFKHVATYSFGGSIPDWYLNGTQSPWGSSIRDWTGVEARFNPQPVPQLSDLLEHYSPETVIIALGTNFLREGNPTSSSLALMSLVAAKRARCFWIGPPNEGAKFQERIARYDAELSEALAHSSCNYISSFPFTAYPEGLGDGIHYDTAGATGVEAGRTWAKRVFEALENRP